MSKAAKTKIAWALLGIALLLVNPAGVCAGTPGAQSPSHPCCPKGPAPQHHSSGTAACVCIDRQPAAPAVPVLADNGPVAAVAVEAALHVTEQPRNEFRSSESFFSPPHDRFVDFHQLLL